jgi:hypothetical protein
MCNFATDLKYIPLCHNTRSIIRMIKSRRMRWAGHVAQMWGEEERVYVIGGKARGKETTRKTKT